MAELTGLGVKLYGGCCGTTPEYIALLREKLAGCTIVQVPRQVPAAVCSGTRTVPIDRVRVIGERINPTGKKLMKEALRRGDVDYMLNQALAQADTILAVNKGDLPGYRLPAPEGAETGHTLTVVELSAKTGLGLAALEQAMGRLADHLLPQVQEEAAGQLLTNGRQTDAVRRALEAVERAQAALEAGVTPDALLTDVEEAMAALGELTGKTLREDITQRIFDRFCVGK